MESRSGGKPLHPLARLDHDDLDMITTFVLESGSIKALARHYGVSYPTMRNRLDELIGRVRRTIEGEKSDVLTRYLAELIEQGRIAPDVARRIRSLHQAGSESGPESEARGDLRLVEGAEGPARG
jgi:hypothetical protein